MSGTMYVLAEILIFMVAATVIGFLLGRWLTRAGESEGESIELVEEIEHLEAELSEARRSTEAVQSRLNLASDAIRELESEKAELVTSHEGLALELAAAEQAGPTLDVGEHAVASDETVAAREAELAGLRAEIERYRAELESRPDRAHEVAQLEAALVTRDQRIERLEAQITAGGAPLPAPVAASEPTSGYGFSTGVGDIADSQIDFEVTGQ